MQENLEIFELNNKVLDDFDNLMKKHLDQIKVLKIYDDIKNTKLFNIIGLCLNINELQITGNNKTDINKIFSSISNPQRIESLNLNSIKLPTTKSFSKFKNLRKIELKNIKFSEVKEFFEKIEFKNLIQEITLENVDFMNQNFEVFSKFNNIKIFKSKNLVNMKFEKMDFLLENKKLEEVEIKGNKILFSELKNLTKGKYKKDIQLQLESISNFKNTIKIKDKKIDVTIAAEDIKSLNKNVNFSLINNIKIIFEEETSFIEFIRVLKIVENDVNICLKEFSKLNTEELIILRDVLKIKNISIINDKNEITNTYEIEEFIKIRDAIEKFIEQVPQNKTDLEKFLWIYKVLLKNIKYDENENIKDEIESGLINNKCLSKGYSQILKNCLNCLKIEATIIEGALKGDNEQWFWIQVKLEDKWYNADLALDAKLNKKMKYCLISNEKISKKHEFINSKSNYCIENIDYKTILQFWKNDTIEKEEKVSIIQNIIEKLKLLLINNKALPEPSKEEEKNDNTK